MYIPKHFEQRDIATLHELIRTYPLATLITFGSESSSANHIPLQLHADKGVYGALAGHLPRANPLASEKTTEIEALAIFHGPNTYISPTWYATKQESEKVVPTWNYTVAHARGRIRFIDDAKWLREHLEGFTDQHEAGQPSPWSITDAPPHFISTLLTHLIGIEIVIDKLEGKWKVSQNRPVADRHSIIAALSNIASSNSISMADSIRKETLE